MSSLIDGLAASGGLAASIVALILLVLYALLVWRQQRRLAAMQTQLDSLRCANRGLERAVRGLEAAHQALLFRVIRKKQRKALKSSRPSSDAVEEKMTLPIVPKQPDEENVKKSGLYVVAPKTSSE